jgi:receptor protein-tyrosine kinase
VNLQDFVKLVRARWVTVGVTALLTVLGAIAYTLFQTPLYQASTRLFVSTTAGTTATDLVQSSRYSQERVLSYAELLMGETLAQRTIDRLNLDMSAADLKENVTAKSKLNTVLIDVSVRDDSPVQARDIANALSDEFVAMARALETPSGGERPEARVIVEQRAAIPEKPVVPNKRLNIAFGMLLGGILGIGLAIIRDQLDNTIKGQDALEKLAGTGAVGFVPLDKKLAEVSTIFFDTDNSPTAEAFRKLRTNLQFLAVDNPPRVIVVTSASPGEGKTTTSLNIALALAEAEHNVVLVDGDLRRPRLAKILDLIGSVGFSTALSGGAPLNDVLQTTKFPRLTVLTAGTIPPNPSELLGSLAAKNLTTELRSRFDYVIIDSSPLLAVTDGAILSADADGVLIVVRAGKTKRDQLAHAIGMLNDVGAKLLGSVLTMMPTRGSDAYNYGYSYGYGQSSPALAGVSGDETNPNPNQSVRETVVDIDDEASSGESVRRTNSPGS